VKTVTARQANHEFSALLSRAERGEDILINKAQQACCRLESLSAAGDDRRPEKGDPTRD